MPYRDEFRKPSGPFKCYGVRAGRDEIDWEMRGYRPKERRHVCASGGDAHVRIWKYKTYDKLSIKCSECWIKQQERNVKVRQRDELDEANKQAAYQEDLRSASKRQRVETNKKETEQLEKLTTADPAFAELTEKLKKLKGPQLKSLCERNYLMISGSKEQLVSRLANCKNYGGGEVCPTCVKPKLELIFGEDGGAPIAISAST